MYIFIYNLMSFLLDRSICLDETELCDMNRTTIDMNIR